jgi:putative transcriptional regulator
MFRSSALGLFVLLAVASAGTPAGPAEGPSLAGQLLVAAPSIGDPRFHHAVILMVHHDKEGALGIIINHPVGEQPLAKLLADAGDPDAGAEGNIRVFSGGPVQPERGFVIHTTDYKRRATVEVDEHVAMTSSREILHDIGHHQGPEKSLFAFGYSGWGAGQLENEMARNDWYTAPDDTRLVFDDARDQVWDEAMARRTRDL